MLIKEALNFLKNYSLLDATDLVQDELREALGVLANCKIDDVCNNLARALRTAREVRERSK
jgi:hypothetical protein